MIICALVVAIMMCVGTPILGILLLKKRGCRVGKAALCGALAFLISQMCIRLPLLNFLGESTFFIILQTKPVWYGLFFGVTAGIVEETARWLFLKFVVKDCRTMEGGIVFGLGHGGIEAILLVGINLIACLVLALMGQGDILGLDTANVLLAGVERLYAMTFHVGATLIVLWGICGKKSGRYLFLAILLHTVLDAAIVILTVYFNAGILGITLWGIMVSVVTAVIGVRLFCKKKTQA